MYSPEKRTCLVVEVVDRRPLNLLSDILLLLSLERELDEDLLDYKFGSRLSQYSSEVVRQKGSRFCLRFSLT
jgi:hypothetical protein